MATEPLILKLRLQTNNIEARLNKITDEMEAMKAGSDGVDSSFNKLSKTAKTVGGKLKDLTLAVTALATASTAMVLASASNRRELELLSRQAKTSAEDFQALSFATSQYGINAEQIADISKDVSDKVGEFARDATGPFQDYANQLQLTKEQARETAIEFQNLSSEQVIGAMISRMEDANAPADQITQVLESMGNDLSRLAPLFASNSKELNVLKDRFNDVNSSLQITDTQAAALQETSQSWSLLTSAMGNSATAISATVAPVFDDFFNDVIEIIPNATQTVIDFFNSVLDAENITSIAGANKKIKETSELIARQEKIAENSIGRRSVAARGLVNSEKEKLEALKAQLEVLEAQEQSIADAKSLSGGVIGGADGGNGEDEDILGDQKSSELQAIEDSLASETELLNEQYERKLEILDREVADLEERNALKLELEEQYLENYLSLIEDGEEQASSLKDSGLKEREQAEKAAAKTEASIEKGKQQFAMRTAETLLSSSASTQEKLFSVVKDAAASSIEAYGLTAGAKALAELGPIAGPPVSANYIGWSKVAAGVVRALPLGGGGGGSAGAPSGGGNEASVQAEPDFVPDSESLQITESSEGGSNTSNQDFVAGSLGDDDVIDLIMNKIDQRNLQGG